MNWKQFIATLVAGFLLIAGCGGGGFEYNGLYWQVGPDEDLTWDEAKAWVDGLGGNWRMPTMIELRGLWNSGIRYPANWGPFQNTGWWVWSGDEPNIGVNFYGGPDSWSWPSHSSSISSRVFAVRSP